MGQVLLAVVTVPCMADIEEPAERYVPAEIKRAVRQRCGFGCVLCGVPIFQYDHMIPFAEVQEHTEENITLE
jgi:hypothetical protein